MSPETASAAPAAGILSEVEISPRSTGAVARYEARRVAGSFGWDEVAAEQLALSASELAQNIVDHGGGRGLLTFFRTAAGNGVELLAEDNGPGINLEAVASRRIGFGGEGLASTARMMDLLEIALSTRDSGSRVRARKWDPGPVRVPKVVVISRTHPHESVCGDGAYVGRFEKGVRLAVIDGLGHGGGAHEVAVKATDALAIPVSGLPSRALEQIHNALAGTRGAAGVVADIDVEARTLRASGVGNVRLQLHRDDGTRWSPVVSDGILGFSRSGRDGSLGTLHEESAPWDGESILALFSDGLSSRFVLDTIPRIVKNDLLRAAAGGFLKFAVDRDDATLMLAG